VFEAFLTGTGAATTGTTSGHFDDTLIVFTSDHGEMAMDHRQWFKNAMYEGSTRVPLIVSGPNIPKGKIITNFTSLLDIYPTFLDLTSIHYTPLQELEGYSLTPFLQTSNSIMSEAEYEIRRNQLWGGRVKNPLFRENFITSQYHSNYATTGSFMIRQGDWKYIVFGQPTPAPNVVYFPPQLFNVTADPEELTDLHEEYPLVVKQLDELLQKDILYEQVDAEVKKQDVACYMSWARKQKDVWKNFWEIYYIGFQPSDQSKVATWLKRYNISEDTTYLSNVPQK